MPGTIQMQDGQICPDTMGARLRRFREERGMSREHLAERAKTTKTRLWMIESGRTQDPFVQTLAKIAKVLDCTLDELVYGDESK
jgi:transcriptional regulator with XRE-family HTH domain